MQINLLSMYRGRGFRHRHRHRWRWRHGWLGRFIELISTPFGRRYARRGYKRAEAY